MTTNRIHTAALALASDPQDNNIPTATLVTASDPQDNDYRNNLRSIAERTGEAAVARELGIDEESLQDILAGRRTTLDVPVVVRFQDNNGAVVTKSVFSATDGVFYACHNVGARLCDE